MSDSLYNVLFLCTGNSCRSIMAEAILNRLGQGRFAAYSAGSHPTGQVNPSALDLLKSFNYATEAFRSKTWDEFAAEGAPEMQFVFTLCDQAAGEVCPIWTGQPMTAHWPFADPAKFQGSQAETRAHFAEVYGQIHNRIDIFVNLPLGALDRLSLQKRLVDLGRQGPTA